MKQLVYSLLVLAAMAFTFSSCEDVPMPYGWPNATPETPADELPQEGEGTFESPYNVAKANAIIASGDYDGDATVYVKGIITQIEDGLPNSFGNATYFISDDAAGTNKLEVYRGYGFGGAKITAADDIKVGDEVIVEGKLINYSGTYEITQGSKIVYQNGKSSIGGGTPEGEGTFESPYNVAMANDILASNQYDSNAIIYVKGIITEVEDGLPNSYGNATYSISDNAEGINKLEVFRGYGFDGAKITAADDIKVGDEVIVEGKLTIYNGKYEITQGSKIVYQNGKSAMGGGTETGGATGDGSKENPFNSIAANKYAEELGAGNTSEADYYIKGKISNIRNNYDIEHGTAIFSISDDGTTENQFLIYSAYYLDNKAYTEGDLLNLGDEVVICGKITNYNGTCETASKKAYLYSWTKGEGGSGDSGDTSSANGDFETWVDGKPNNWSTASTAGNATLSQSEDAHGGKHSVRVAGNSSSNKRLGYKETELKAGEYTIKFYAKAATSTGGSVRPGFVPVTDGSVGSYVYGDYVNNLGDSWTLVEQKLTVPADGTYCFVIMNSKTPGGDVLIDDFTATLGSTTIIK